MTRPASSTEEIDGSKLPPLLLHFDVNKTLIIADSIMNKSTEYTIREVIANQFWGFPTQVKSGESGELRTVWKWDGRPPSVCPTSSPNLERPSSRTASRRPSRNDPSPGDAEDVRQRLSVPVKEATLKEEGAEPVSYLQFARNTVQGDQSAVRLATRSFERVIDAECKQMMLALAEQAVGNLLIPPAQRTEELQKETGLIGEWKLIFPSFFRLIANLQRERRHFAVMFRSFGTDLLRVCAEWNAFCEGKHPLLKECMEGVPKMDGSVPGVPDRRLAEGSIHTMYRDAEGPLLALGLTTNGNWEGEWDQWARSGSQDDTRGGRAFLRDQGVETVKGYLQLQAWFKEQLYDSRTNIVREDFAWWHHSREVATAGKLMIGIEDVQQVFFDDNIATDDSRIVDPRFANSFLPVPAGKCLGRACIQVDTLQAMLNESYFIDVFYAADVSSDVLWKDSEPEGSMSLSPLDKHSVKRAGSQRRNSVTMCTAWGPMMREVSSRSRSQSNAHDSNSEDSYTESVHDTEEEDQEEPLVVTDLDALRELLSSSGVDVSKFGAPGTTYKTVDNLHQELIQKKCIIKRTKDGTSSIRVRREMEVMRMKLMCNNLILVETHEQMPDGRLRSRNGYLPATKKRHGETLGGTIDRWAIEELQITISQEQKAEAVKSCQHKYDVTEETMSYPLPCATHYLEVCCRLKPELMPQRLLDKLGLPAGSMFSTRGMKKKQKGMENEAGPMRFWSWYRSEVWEAMTLSEDVDLPDVQAGMEELFKGHARRDAYSSLLLQMFDCFSASKLCGGLSGSLVLQVQPVDPIDGKNEEAVIVKLDKADVVSREIANSKRVWNALSDRAARILGQGCFYTDSTSVEYGAFKIELAGGCWQVPELAGGARTKDLLMTFKDLLAVESQRQLLDTDMHHLVSTSGDVELVLFELLGPGGMLRVLRREHLIRSPRNLFGSFTYTGKDTKWNPLYTPNHFQLAPMQELWRRSFGMRGAALEMPDVRKKVQDLISRFAALEQSPLGRYKPIMGLAHGDLNAMNVLIDVMDAVWLIDFAFSEEKPLCWDLAKLEVAFMFEYAVLPVSWRTLLDFAGDDPEVWKARKVHTWLGVSEPVAYALLEELVQMRAQKPEEGSHYGSPRNNPEGRVSTKRKPSYMGGGNRRPSWRRLPKRRGLRTDKPEYIALERAIWRACESCYKEQPMDRSKEKKRDTELCRLCALLLATQEEEEAALEQAAVVTRTMLLGDTLQTVMEPPPVRLQKEEGASLNFCWSKVARLRLFFKEEWLELRRRAETELGPLYAADESPLVHWLGLLQESYRLLGYFDVAPWVKVWSVFFLEGLVSRISHELDKADSALGRLCVDGRRASKAAVSTWLPRLYPSEMDIALRTLAQRGGTPCALSTRRRIRLLHAKSPDLCELGGLFAEVRNVASVTVDKQVVRAELVRTSEGDGESSRESLVEDEDALVAVHLRGGTHDGVQVGVLELTKSDALPAVLRLTVPLVPLGENSLSQQDRRRGVRAFGETPEGQEVAVVFAVTETAFCYPPGQRLSVAPNNMWPLRSGMRLQLVTIEEFNERTGNYSVSHDNVEKNAFEETEADPFEGNHLLAPATTYPEATKLMALCPHAGGSFVDVVVTKRPQKEGSVRHLLEQTGTGKEFWLDLNDFNHSVRRGRIGSEANFEEVRRYRVFAKAKHSFIYTVTSERADVLEGPVPRMADESGRETFFWSEVQALISEDHERLSSHIFFHGTLILGEPGSGKSSLLCKLAMHCLSSATMLLPVLIPVIDLCSRLLKAGDAGAVEETCNDAEGLVDWYLRMVYGGDTNRFFMLRQALECHRLLLLFDGIDEAGPLAPRMERCITGLVALNHRVVATARLQDDPSECPAPQDKSSHSRWRSCLYPSWLTTAPSLFRVLELLPLELECRRSLVEVLLAREQGLCADDTQSARDFVEDFIMHLDEDEGRKWSTPLMVSMLVASWREKKRQDERRTRKAMPDSWNYRTLNRWRGRERDHLTSSTSSEAWRLSSDNSVGSQSPSRKQHVAGVDVREVYRVALDLLLRRFQSRQQADRHKMKDTVQKFKELLEIIAERMAPGTKEFTEAHVLPLLDLHDIDIQVWRDLSEAIREGRVPLLQTKTDHQDGGTVRFLFTYGSFQRFLSSCASPTRFVSSAYVARAAKAPGTDSEPLNGKLDRYQAVDKVPVLARVAPRRFTVSSPVDLLWTILVSWGCCFRPRSRSRTPEPSGH